MIWMAKIHVGRIEFTNFSNTYKNPIAYSNIKTKKNNLKPDLLMR